MSAGLLKNKLISIIRELCENRELLDQFVKNPGKDFTRDRKLSLDVMLKMLIGMQGGTIARELFDYKPPTKVTSSAFIQQRDKILPEMLEYILHRFNDVCSESLRYRGYELLACDGSGISIATDDGAPTYVKNGSLEGYNCFHLNTLFDLCNKNYVDVHIEPRPEYNETAAAIRMIERREFNKSIFIGDRGYGALNLMEHINRIKGLDFLIRVKENWITETAALPMEELDTEISFELRTTQTKEDKELYKSGKAKFIAGKSKFGKQKKKTTWDFESPYQMKLRIVRFQISENNYETIATSLNRFEFPLEEIKWLYHMRWGIETAFRELKYAIGTINFHAKKESAVKQELFARLIMYNFSMKIALGTVITKNKQDKMEEKLKEPVERLSKETPKRRKWVYQVNYTYAIHVCREFFRHHSDTPPPDVEAEILSHILPVRPGRKDKRKLIKQKKFVWFLYRVA